MERTCVLDLKPGKSYRVGGFVSNLRLKKTMAFLVLRDRTGQIQITIDRAAHPAFEDALSKLTVESVITAQGVVAENAYVKLGGIELLPETLTIESLADAYPLLADSAIDVRLDYRWLDLRAEKQRVIFEIQTTLANAVRDFLRARAFTEIHTPKLIAAASESGADVFEVKYFDRKAYLAQSPQFYKQMAMAAGLERIFEIGPVFRAEKSHTNRHATEFTGVDLEFSFIDSYRDVMSLEGEMLAFALGQVKEKHGSDVARLFGEEVVVPRLPFPEIKLRALYGELEKRYGYAVAEEEMGDMTTEAEQLARTFAMEEYGHEFLFVTDFSKEKRAFYHMREDGVPQGYDLIWRGVEITTGAQREHRYDVLRRQAEEKGLAEDVRFYLEFFRYGCPPHGGFGLGLDRLTMLLLNVPIKEAMFLFRGPSRLTP